MSMITLHTNGSGYWSKTAAAVRVVGMETDIFLKNGKPSFGELRVYFDTDSWTVDRLGLIYTDKLFLTQLNLFLSKNGLVGVDYSEQGMQGIDYVSLDASALFCSQWLSRFGTESSNVRIVAF